MQADASRVLEIDYMKWIRFSLNSISYWPNNTFGGWTRKSTYVTVYRYMLIIICSLSTISQSIFLKNRWETLTFMDIGQIYTYLALNSLFLQRATLAFTKKYCLLIKEFVSQFHLLHHQHKSEFAEKEHKKVDKMCRIVSLILHIQLLCGITSYNISPIFMNYTAGMYSKHRPENKTFIHSVDYALPFDCYTDTLGYLIVFLYNWFPSYYVPSSFCFLDLLLFIMVFHIVGHFNVLSYNLKTFPLPSGSSEQSLRDYNEEVVALLKSAINDYQVIKQFIKLLSQALDTTLIFYLIFHQVMCCLLLLECSTLTLEALVKYGVLTLVIFQQLIQVSVVFEFIQAKSDNLGNEVYALPWELMNVHNRRIVLLFLRDSQKSLGTVAGGMIPLGVKTMSQILKTTFSYYLILSTLDSSAV